MEEFLSNCNYPEFLLLAHTVHVLAIMYRDSLLHLTENDIRRKVSIVVEEVNQSNLSRDVALVPVQVLRPDRIQLDTVGV